jgi:hypothetical protein
MSRYYDTKEQALQKGLEYAGRHDLSIMTLDKIFLHTDVEIDTKTSLVGILGAEVLDTTILEFPNGNSEKVKIASGQFRSGYDLWFILPNGMAFRI